MRMRKRDLLLFLLLFCSIGIRAQQGVSASLKYQRLPDMGTPRYSHQTFAVGSGFMVVGGYDNTLTATKSAELYQDGKWKTLSLPAGADDPTFAVNYGAGLVLLGGGNPTGAGTGQQKATVLYEPMSGMFFNGPDMTVARSHCNGIIVDNSVYVAGNWYGDDEVFDRYDGEKFSATGRTSGHHNPYIIRDTKGNVTVFSTKDNQGNDIANIFVSDMEWFPLDMYVASDDMLYTLRYAYYVAYRPLDLPVEMSSTDYYSLWENKYYVLTLKGKDEYMLTWINPVSPEEMPMNYCGNLVIPNRSPESGAAITWRGGAYVNNAKGELYLIGSSGSGKSNDLHIISYNFKTEAWSISTANGFDTDLTTAAWTLLDDGHLACSGGAAGSSKAAYIFAPPTAGKDDSAIQGSDDTDTTPSEWSIIIFTKDQKQHEFQLAGNRPEVKFGASTLQVIISSAVQAEFSQDDVVKITYKNPQQTDIDSPVADRNTAEINYQDDGLLVISRLSEGAAVSIYAMDGRLLRRLSTSGDGTCRLDLSALPKGVYLVKTDTITYKIMKR